MPVPKISFRYAKNHCDFTAAIYAFDRGHGTMIPQHCHEFYEMMYVMEGEFVHETILGKTVGAAGDLFFIRPPDIHAISRRPGQPKVEYINVEFAEESWREFCRVAGLSLEMEQWDAAADCIAVTLEGDEREQCAEAFRRALNIYFAPREGASTLTEHFRSPRRLDLCRFLVSTVGFLPAVQRDEGDVRYAPPWLRQACLKMEGEPLNAQVGLDRLVALSGVSVSHLARTIKACTGMTPTEYINDIRLRNAALLLTTTARSILDIAIDCGFDNLSYFYRLFGRKYHQSPHRHRLAARQSAE